MQPTNPQDTWKPDLNKSCWSFIERISRSADPGFYLEYPSGSSTVRGVHNANKRAIAWETSISFGAYRLENWINYWHHQPDQITPQEQILLQAWHETLKSSPGAEAIIGCWHRRPRPEHYPTTHDPERQSAQLESWNKEQQQAISLFNQWVELCRNKLSAQGQEARTCRTKELAQKNYNSVMAYLDRLRSKYSRLLMVRLDVFYKREFANSKSLLDLQSERRAFFDRYERKRAFRHLVGYVWCFEQGEKKGLHCHLLLIFDGRQRFQDEWIGKELGEHWVEVTRGQGWYYNANHKDSKKDLAAWQAKGQAYSRLIRQSRGEQEAESLVNKTLSQQLENKNTLGIGAVSRNNEVCWENVAILMRYFTKIDQSIPSHLKRGIRCFGRGQ